MNIVADANIPFAVQAFSCFGNVRVAPGRAIDKAMVADADMLLVRSVTRVDRNLLENSHVRFVGTATIGIDHVDTGYLAAQGIAFASAPGSNAQSVAEYVACSLVHVYHGDLTELSGKTLGVIGAGNVGSRVLKSDKVLACAALSMIRLWRRQAQERDFPRLKKYKARRISLPCMFPSQTRAFIQPFPLSMKRLSRT